MKGATVNISMMLTVLLAAALAAGACRKTDVEINDGSGSGGSVSEDVPMTFSVSAEAHQSTKAVLVPDQYDSVPSGISTDGMRNTAMTPRYCRTAR